jgi:hypothetical protein
MKNPSSELRRLTDAWHNGTISPEDGMRLEQRLAADESARQYFFEIAGIEASMAEAASLLPRQVPSVRSEIRGIWWKTAAVFIIGLICGALVIKLQPFHESIVVAPTQAPPAAMVTGMLGVVWAGQPEEHSVALHSGLTKSQFKSGLIELTFASGTRALVEGPAEFQIMGSNAIRLTHGKLVADVPKGAEGFSVTYRDGKIVDLGTEFGVEIASNGRSANFGVFRGEIEFHPQSNAHQAIHLRENHALLAENGTTISVPFEQKKFTRKLPSREFAWEVQKSDPTPKILEFDVSHLIWKPGTYRTFCKWMTGLHGISTDRAELLLDGLPVAEDSHFGETGSIRSTHHSSYELTVSPAAYHRGRWTLRIHARITQFPGQSYGESNVAGVILFEEGLVTKAKPVDFFGTWEYVHDGKVFRRSFLPDQSATLTIDGIPYDGYDTSHWKVDDGNLILSIHQEGEWIQEVHVLRDPNTLIFVNCAYRNAVRIGQGLD